MMTSHSYSSVKRPSYDPLPAAANINHSLPTSDIPGRSAGRNSSGHQVAPVSALFPSQPPRSASPPSVRELAKAFETPPVARFAPPGSQFATRSRDSSPVRTLRTGSPEKPTFTTSTLPVVESPVLPSLKSFHHYTAQMQDMRGQQTSYLGGGGLAGGEGSFMPYDEGQRRMSEFRLQRQSDASFARSRQSGPQNESLYPLPPPHAYGYSGRSADSSPERSFSPARSYRDERSPSPAKRNDQQPPYTHAYSSTNNLLGAAAASAFAAGYADRPSSRLSSNRTPLGSRPGSYYKDNASDAGSAYQPSILTPNNAAAAGLGTIDPTDIADDEVDDPVYAKKAAGGAYASSLLGFGNGPAYDQLPGGGGEKGFGGSFTRQPPKQRKLGKLLQGIFWTAAVVVTLAIIAGVVLAVLADEKTNAKSAGVEEGPSFSLFGNSGSSSASNSTSGFGSSSSGTSSSDGDSGFTASSPEILSLMKNENLHKVFPGIDYTPMNAQYPGCLTTPPTQDNVTRDIALISQLTNTVRLYGTDCNQTELVLTAIDRLNLTSSVKLWANVWLENNATTNNRQLAQMYSVLSQYGTSQLTGIILGNEVLYRQDMTQAQLIANITEFRTNMSSLYPKANLKLATSDIGSAWTSTLAEAVDVVMSNIHPFFGGVPAPQASTWTWNFFQEFDVPVTAGLTGKEQIIAETGWPTGGGNECGTGAACASSTDGSVAGVEELNLFLNEWVCGSLANATTYFWFEAFDEPWKAVYNTPTESWETQWGLFDVNRNLKTNVTIPSCGGKTVA